MKLRTERNGYHLFDRLSGLHILLDEICPDPNTLSVAPRTLSIALWNICDLRCRFCYRPRTSDMLALSFVRSIAAAADKLGSLEITFGGGEPLSYPHLTSACAWIWENTSLAISLTTHGHRLTPELAARLAGRISSIRFSIDGGEPYYSEIRSRPLAQLLRNIRAISGTIPFGINAVVSPGHIEELRRVAEIAIELGSSNLLIIPEHHEGNVLLNEHELNQVKRLITEYQPRLRLYLTSTVSAALDVDLLPTESANEFTFAHVSADRRLRIDSYGRDGIMIEDVSQMENYFAQLSSFRDSRMTI